MQGQQISTDGSTPCDNPLFVNVAFVDDCATPPPTPQGLQGGNISTFSSHFPPLNSPHNTQGSSGTSVFLRSPGSTHTSRRQLAAALKGQLHSDSGSSVGSWWEHAAMDSQATVDGLNNCSELPAGVLRQEDSDHHRHGSSPQKRAATITVPAHYRSAQLPTFSQSQFVVQHNGKYSVAGVVQPNDGLAATQRLQHRTRENTASSGNELASFSHSDDDHNGRNGGGWLCNSISEACRPGTKIPSTVHTTHPSPSDVEVAQPVTTSRRSGNCVETDDVENKGKAIKKTSQSATVNFDDDVDFVPISGPIASLAASHVEELANLISRQSNDVDSDCD